MSTEQLSPHLTEEQAFHLAEGGPVPEEFRSAVEHFEACRPCRRIVRSVKQVVRALRQEQLPTVPPHLSARVLDLINEPISAPESVLRPRTNLLGRLIFERPIPMMSVRSGGASAGRQFRFNTDDESIDLTVSDIGPETVGVRAVVLSVAEPVRAILVTENGEEFEALISDSSFSFNELPKGKAKIQIVFENREITFDIVLN